MSRSDRGGEPSAASLLLAGYRKHAAITPRPHHVPQNVRSTSSDGAGGSA